MWWLHVRKRHAGAAALPAYHGYSSLGENHNNLVMTYPQTSTQATNSCWDWRLQR
jgi:hypothetical protein